jgi:hypothetical protein
MLRIFRLTLSCLGAAVAIGAAPFAFANGGDVNWSVTIGSPSYPAPRVYAPPPVVYSPPPVVYVRPQPVFVQPAPVVSYGQPYYVQEFRYKKHHHHRHPHWEHGGYRR